MRPTEGISATHQHDEVRVKMITEVILQTHPEATSTTWAMSPEGEEHRARNGTPIRATCPQCKVEIIIDSKPEQVLRAGTGLLDVKWEHDVKG